MYLPVLKDNNKKWHVFYTRSRSEKKVNLELQHLKVETFLPMVKEIKQWSDRKKKIESPLFKSYIFINCNEHDIQVLLQWVPDLISYVRYNGKAAVLRQQEVDSIRRFIDTGLRVEAASYENFGKGDQVRIIGGPLEGLRGEVHSGHNSDYFVIRIEAIHQIVKIQVGKEYLQRIV